MRSGVRSTEDTGVDLRAILGMAKLSCLTKPVDRKGILQSRSTMARVVLRIHSMWHE